MSDSGLGEELTKFIAQNIESIEKLEILLTLARSAEKPWSVSDMYQEIQSSMVSVEKRLAELTSAGFAKRESNGFRYAPNSEEPRRLISTLDQAYRTRRIKVIESIFSRKTEQIQKFAEAFKFRKDNT